jgi:uncharacterized repeat protein (TIGR03803 family)
MRFKQSLLSTTILGAVLAASLASDVSAATYKILHAFGQGTDGGGLYGGVVFDQNGNLWGGTSGGGDYGYGTIYRLSPQPGGKWSETVLCSFANGGPDGDIISGNLTIDAAGNLYGTLSQDGGPYTYGTVFTMPASSNGCNLTVLHRFAKGDPAGGAPSLGVAPDAAGNLFGLSSAAFELSPGANGWTETILYPNTALGYGGPPVLDAAGNIYAANQNGGRMKVCPGEGCGTVAELSPQPDGSWLQTILYAFRGLSDGVFPAGLVALDPEANVYGSASGGGTGDADGVIFKVSRRPNGQWKETVLYTMETFSEGDSPSGGLVRDSAGNLYGVTIAGGDKNCDCGVVFELSPQGGDKWTYKVLHRFTGDDGAQPAANLTLDGKGHIYGTAITAGPGGAGVVFEITL